MFSAVFTYFRSRKKKERASNADFNLQYGWSERTLELFSWQFFNLIPIQFRFLAHYVQPEHAVIFLLFFKLQVAKWRSSASDNRECLMFSFATILQLNVTGKTCVMGSDRDGFAVMIWSARLSAKVSYRKNDTL